MTILAAFDKSANIRSVFMGAVKNILNVYEFKKCKKGNKKFKTKRSSMESNILI
jgi:hypothetical protein